MRQHASVTGHAIERQRNDHTITFARGGPRQSDDNGFVERRISLAVKRPAGYGRHDTPEEPELLDKSHLRLRPYMDCSSRCGD